jgi:hypothetical protein
MSEIFVFGSNLAGIHGAGAAKYAHENHHAVMGCGIGRTGDAYAIPTKDLDIITMPLERISPHVKVFLDYAEAHPHIEFRVTRIGCGLAGYKDINIAPMFKYAPRNCILPIEWRDYVYIDDERKFWEYKPNVMPQSRAANARREADAATRQRIKRGPNPGGYQG